jgi:phosphoribosylamine--glycine ligase
VPGFGPGIDDRLVTHPDLRLDDHDGICELARTLRPDHIVVANTAALARGLVDRLRAEGHPCTGPTLEDCALETSKAFGKAFCDRWGIPVAPYRTFTTLDEASAYVRARNQPLVVKADGLCAGNGSVVCPGPEEADGVLAEIFGGTRCGRVGEPVVIEDVLIGREVSLFGFVHATGIATLPLTMDYPWSGDGDTGITCGGVGAIAPHPEVRPEEADELIHSVWAPTWRGLAHDHPGYRGFIYLGCMLTAFGPHVLEINVRLGDPEAQAVLPLLTGDVLQLCADRAPEGLTALPFSDDATCCIVAFQGRTRQMSKGRSKGWYRGWPEGRYGRGYEIQGLGPCRRPGGHVFAGEVGVGRDGTPISDGGRVVSVVGRGPEIASARDRAYEILSTIRFEGLTTRSDIGAISKRVAVPDAP